MIEQMQWRGAGYYAAQQTNSRHSGATFITWYYVGQELTDSSNHWGTPRWFSFKPSFAE